MIDILSRHNEEQGGGPKVARRTIAPRFPIFVSAEYGFLVRWVIRLSRGTIRDERSAVMVLAVILGITAVLSFINFFHGFTADVYDYLPKNLQFRR